MVKNFIIILLVLAVLAESGYILNKRSSQKVLSASTNTQITPSAPPRLKPVLLEKGMKLADNPVAKFAYKIAPGDLSDEAKKVMTGFNMDSKTQSDGSIIVTLSPKDSEDQSQQYTVKPGETLYFVEMTPADDKTDQDKDLNYRDDYGVIVDQNGLVQ